MVPSSFDGGCELRRRWTGRLIDRVMNGSIQHSGLLKEYPERSWKYRLRSGVRLPRHTRLFSSDVAGADAALMKAIYAAEKTLRSIVARNSSLKFAMKFDNMVTRRESLHKTICT